MYILIKQPNGKYCYSKPGTLNINLTKEKYMQMRLEETAKAVETEIQEENLFSIADLIKYQKVTDEQLKEMGCDKTYDEMLRYIPKEVRNKSYCDRDCTHYGFCPNCGRTVQNGMAGTDEVCKKCGQALEWY